MASFPENFSQATKNEFLFFLSAFKLLPVLADIVILQFHVFTFIFLMFCFSFLNCLTVYFSDSMTGVLSRCINSLQLQDEFNSDSTEKSESDNANLLLKKVRKNFVLENSKWNRFEFCSICAKALDGVNFHRFSDQLTTSRLLRIPARRFSSSSLTESSRSVIKRFFFASLCPSCAPALAIVWLRVASNVASCHFDRQHCLIWRKKYFRVMQCLRNSRLLIYGRQKEYRTLAINANLTVTRAFV